ncbi:MAG: bifunctional DNA primase/polymerase [bacterium]
MAPIQPWRSKNQSIDGRTPGGIPGGAAGDVIAPTPPPVDYDFSPFPFHAAPDGSPMVDWALAYAAAGGKVLPLRPRGKEPLTEHGFHDASNDPAQIRTWWAATPDANIGLRVPEGMLVIDVDPRNGDDHVLAKLEAEHGPLPATLRARTGSGGDHVWLAGQSSGSSLAGVLVKHHANGYVVVPPSVHPDGPTYGWPEVVAVAQVPAWVLEAIASTPASSADTPLSTVAVDRATMLTDLPEDLREHARTGAHPDPTKCRGADGEVLDTRSLHAFVLKAIGRVPDSQILGIILNPAFGISGAVLRVGKANPEREARRQLKRAYDSPYAPKQKPARELCWDAPTCAQLYEKKLEAPVPLVGGVMKVGSLGILVGPGGVGKSFAALDLALSLAAGEPWLGKVPTTGEPKKVALLFLELDEWAARERVRAIMRRRSLSPEVLGRVKILANDRLGSGTIDLLAAEDASGLRRLADGCDLLVVDAVSRIHSLNENDNSEMGRLLAVCHAICVEMRVAVLLVHHMRKIPAVGGEVTADSARGASRFTTDPQVVVLMYRRGGAVRLEFRKTNLGRMPEPVLVAMADDGAPYAFDAPAGGPVERRFFAGTTVQGSPGITGTALVAAIMDRFDVKIRAAQQTVTDLVEEKLLVASGLPGQTPRYTLADGATFDAEAF